MVNGSRNSCQTMKCNKTKKKYEQNVNNIQVFLNPSHNSIPIIEVKKYFKLKSDGIS